MKKQHHFRSPALLLGTVLLFFRSCADPADARYTLVLPDLPSPWTALLGSPRWKIDYVNAGGVKQTFESGGEGVEGAEVSLPPYTASAVAAWPFWPDRGIHPGLFRPAGALYPFDVAGAALTLSWRGGVEAFFYWELAAAAGQADPSSSSAVLRRPWNFDWPRFRELLSDPAVDEAVRADPWAADWRSIAEKTVRSGFNQRRIAPVETGLVPVPVGEGPWFGVSPFAAPWQAGPEEPPRFPVGTGTESYFSPAGTLRVNRETWILLPWP